MKVFILFFLVVSISISMSCKTTPVVVQNEKPIEVEKATEAPPDISGDLWLNDDTYMVSATGYPRTDANSNMMDSALDAAYELAYIKVEYAFLKEMRALDNRHSEAIKKIIDMYKVETKVNYIDSRYVDLTMIVQAKDLREHLKKNTLVELLYK